MRSKKGFTLIELLVVIAIIAILAAILFPVFALARAKARQNTCLSNMKQITLGCLMYTQDWDEKLPTSPLFTTKICANGEKQVISWQNSIEPYIRNRQLFNCPSDPSGNNAFSYAANLVLINSQIVIPKPVKLGKVQDPAGTLLFYCGPLNSRMNPRTGFNDWRSGRTDTRDVYLAGYLNKPPSLPSGASTDANTIPGEAFSISYGTNSQPMGVIGGCWNAQACKGTTSAAHAFNLVVHNGGSNYSFVDGHVKWYRIESARKASGWGTNPYSW